MLPSIHIFGFHLPMYTAMLVLGIALFLFLYFRAYRTEYKADRVPFHRMTFAALLSIAALGLFAFLFNSLFHSIEEGKLVLGGITWLGGVVGAFPAILILTHLLVPKKRGYALDVLDSLIPGVAVAHGLGRVGCFLGGCCFGKVTDSPLGVVFPEGSIAEKMYPNPVADGSLPVLPTQLIEAAFEILLFVALILISRRTKRYNTAIWSVAYAVFRFVLELWRGDDRGSAVLSLSPAQVLSILLFLFGILVILMRLGYAPRRLMARMDAWRAEADALPITPYAAVTTRETAERLRTLHALREEGLVTEEEYEAKRKEILERL